MEWLVYYLVIALLVLISVVMGWWMNDWWRERQGAPHDTSR